MMMMSDDIGELSKALALAQPKIKGATKDAKNGHLNNRYADLGSTWDACRDALGEHGLSVVQLPTPIVTVVDSTDDPDRRGWDPPRMALDTILLHSSGQWIGSRILLDYGSNKAVNPMQALGSALTYARRYGLAAIVGVCPEDDDGEAAGRSRQAPARNAESTAASPRAATPPKPSAMDPYIDRWHAFEPIGDDKDFESRRSRLLNALISKAVEQGKLAEGAVCVEGVRDRKLCWDAAKRLWDGEREFVRQSWDAYLAEKQAQTPEQRKAS